MVQTCDPDAAYTRDNIQATVHDLSVFFNAIRVRYPNSSVVFVLREFNFLETQKQFVACVKTVFAQDLADTALYYPMIEKGTDKKFTEADDYGAFK
jgi:hypothetical protein